MCLDGVHPGDYAVVNDPGIVKNVTMLAYCLP